MLDCLNVEKVRKHREPEKKLIVNSSDDRLAATLRLAVRTFNASAGVISVIDEDGTHPLAAVGTDKDADVAIPSWCHQSVAAGPFIMSCIPADSRFRIQPQNPSKNQIQFMAGSSLVNPEGAILGNLCVFNETPQTQSEFDIQALRDLALLAEAELGRRILDSVQHDLIAQIRTEQHRALIDPLTQVWNREGIRQFLADHATSINGNATSAAIMMVDLDHFKQVNDQWGHDVGDQVLQEATRRMKSVLRLTDAIGRMGGEEFLLVLGPNCPKDQALNVAQRVRKCIADKPIKTDTSDICISISVGLALQSDLSDATIDHQIKRADAALYKAKHDGRNRVVVAD